MPRTMILMQADSHHINDISLLRLMQLVSPGLPVGAYAYSQGLEYAVATGTVRDETTTQHWICGVMEHAVCRLDVPILMRLHAAWHAADHAAVEYWSAFLHACRESAELQAEDRHLGAALSRLLVSLDIGDAKAWMAHPHTSFATPFALAAVRWNIPVRALAMGYVWTWLENQVAAALKLISLGQTAGQRVLSHAIGQMPVWVENGMASRDEDIGVFVPMAGIFSALHETQYSRLFRS